MGPRGLSVAPTSLGRRGFDGLLRDVVPQILEPVILARLRREDVQNHIEALVAEEHELFDAAQREGGQTPEEHRRREEIRVELDRYWDLLRQRRAQEEFGLDPDNSQMRAADIVERYKQ